MSLPIGAALSWTRARRPVPTELRGSYVRLRPVPASTDAEPLDTLSHLPTGDPSIWTYPFDGPYDYPDDFRRALEAAETSPDPMFFTLVSRFEERPLGLASYLRITPNAA